MIAFTFFAIAATLRSLAHPVVRSHVRRDNAASVSILSTDAVDTFHGHALLAQAAYCDDAAAALPQIDMLLIGGDGGETPRCEPVASTHLSMSKMIWTVFVGHDPSTNNLVIAHEGTATNNLSSILIDAQLLLSPLNTTFFPNAPSGIEVHQGFGKTFELTANEILNAVQKGISTNNVSRYCDDATMRRTLLTPLSQSATVLVSGHSLGAALAGTMWIYFVVFRSLTPHTSPIVMTSIFLKQNLNGLNVSTAVFGLPRGGNQAWADFVDANVTK
jgi:hypothetical protein